jgi:hypothetical protein
LTCNCSRVESLKKIYRKRGKKLDAALSDLKTLVPVSQELETCKQQAATVSQELEVCKQQNARLREDLYKLVLGISTAQPQQPMLAFRNSNVVVCNYQVSTPTPIWMLFLKSEFFPGTGQGPALLWQQGSCPTNAR